MNKTTATGLMLVLTMMAAFGYASQSSASDGHNEQSPRAASNYIVMGDDLQQLKDDFNANAGRVRLLFISGPTCGICLRGMADLNDEFIAASQNDDRLVTFVVHVPTLGATEQHALDSIPLLDGPRVHHYWEESGIIGNHYKAVMDVRLYVWDFWIIYGPDARWDDVLPPTPDYYEHQLAGFFNTAGGFPKARVLDAERFAAETGKYLDAVDASRFASDVDTLPMDRNMLADGTLIPVVAQPRNVAVSQHIRNRGGYTNLKRIQTVEMRGQLEANGQSYPLTISTSRPNQIRRVLTVGNRTSVAELSADGQVILDPAAGRGLPAALETILLETFEFDGGLIEWPDKGHEVSMEGMQKIGDVLAWKLEFVQQGGQRWELFINSHGGDIVVANLLGDNDDTVYSILQSDFRETAGFKFAHRIEYVDGRGRSLGVEVIDEIIVEAQAVEQVGQSDLRSTE